MLKAYPGDHNSARNQVLDKCNKEHQNTLHKIKSWSIKTSCGSWNKRSWTSYQV